MAFNCKTQIIDSKVISSDLSTYAHNMYLTSPKGGGA